MQRSQRVVIGIGIVTALFCMLCMLPVLSASGTDDLEPAMVDLKSIPTAGEGLTSDGEPAKAEAPIPTEVGATPWGIPVQVSPDNGTWLYHYPRKVTLAWNRVTGATQYKVERAYLSGSTWISYSVVYLSGFNNSSYTFTFVGDQPGRWRVSAYNGSVWTAASPWWTFTFRTKAYMPTPVLTSPSAEEVFDHYPRYVTLAWKMIPDAAGYKLEVQYCNPGDKYSCTSYSWSPLTVPTYGNTPYLVSSHTFAFVGKQPGRWRVTALGGSNFYDSVPSAWRYFYFGI